MRPTAMSEEDLKWQRRSDARTLAEAEQIKADKERLKGAQIGATEILQEKASELAGLSKVVGKKVKTPKADPMDSNTRGAISSTTANVPFSKSGYRNPATLGRL